MQIGWRAMHTEFKPTLNGKRLSLIPFDLMSSRRDGDHLDDGLCAMFPRGDVVHFTARWKRCVYDEYFTLTFMKQNWACSVS